MKAWQFALVVIFFVAVMIGLLSLLPQRQTLFNEIGSFFAGVWYLIYNLVLISWMLVGSALLGFLAKAYGVNAIDDIFLPNKVMEDWMRYVLCALFAVIVFLIWIVMVPALMQPWNFLWVAASSFGWSGAYETPPIWWGVWAIVPFWLAWASTDHTQFRR